MKKNLPNFAARLILAAMLAALAGCASHNYEQGQKTSAGLTEAADKIAAGSGKIDAVLAALNDLVNDPSDNLVSKFDKFNDAVNDLQSTAQNVDSKVSDMRANGKEYFEAWDQQLAAIKNEDIRNRSSERKTELSQKFSDIKSSYTKAQTAFKPFMSDLKDIQAALNTDLTVGGVGAIKGAAATANQDGMGLKTSVGRLSDEFKDLGVAMSPTAPAQ